jgi:hypothetical protein
VIVKIPQNQASGIYKLVMLRAFAEPGILIQYNSPADFKERTYTIENPKRFVKPTVKSVTEP